LSVREEEADYSSAALKAPEISISGRTLSIIAEGFFQNYAGDIFIF
jgi:hypothetical protein